MVFENSIDCGTFLVSLSLETFLFCGADFFFSLAGSLAFFKGGWDKDRFFTSEMLLLGFFAIFRFFAATLGCSEAFKLKPETT